MVHLAYLKFGVWDICRRNVSILPHFTSIYLATCSVFYLGLLAHVVFFFSLVVIHYRIIPHYGAPPLLNQWWSLCLPSGSSRCVPVHYIGNVSRLVLWALISIMMFSFLAINVIFGAPIILSMASLLVAGEREITLLHILTHVLSDTFSRPVPK